MGLLSKSPMTSEDRLLVSEKAASNLLSLAAQIALEVRLVTGLMTVTIHQSEKSWNVWEHRFCAALIKVLSLMI